MIVRNRANHVKQWYWFIALAQVRGYPTLAGSVVCTSGSLSPAMVCPAQPISSVPWKSLARRQGKPCRAVPRQATMATRPHSAETNPDMRPPLQPLRARNFSYSIAPTNCSASSARHRTRRVFRGRSQFTSHLLGGRRKSNVIRRRL